MCHSSNYLSQNFGAFLNSSLSLTSLIESISKSCLSALLSNKNIQSAASSHHFLCDHPPSHWDHCESLHWSSSPQSVLPGDPTETSARAGHSSAQILSVAPVSLRVKAKARTVAYQPHNLPLATSLYLLPLSPDHFTLATQNFLLSLEHNIHTSVSGALCLLYFPR